MIELTARLLQKILALLILLAVMPLQAEVIRIEVTATIDIPSNGRTPAYEERSGKIYFAIDPLASINTLIADLDKAPRNAEGKVEFSANFVLRRPKRPSEMNGVLLFEAPNRGRRRMESAFSRPLGVGSQRDDAFLLQQGFTLFWVGWQFDVPHQNGALRVEVPVARQADSHAIHGWVRSDAANKGPWLALADRDHIAYPMSDPDDVRNVLSVRDCVTCERRSVPREQWHLGEDGKNIFISSGQPQKIYELVYRSTNPPIAGLGFAAVRDAVSKLKYAPVPELSLQPNAIKHTVGFGVSQSARFLRTYNYFGFNEDAQHRRVFDGMIIHVAGAGRGSFNQRFAQPSRDAHPYLNFFYPTDVFPFTDTEQFDPEIGQSDGLLKRLPAKLEPKIFYTNASYEYWGRCASLIHTNIDGGKDAHVPPNVRIYFFAGGKHTSGGNPAMSTYQQHLRNPLDYGWGLRGLLIAMNGWVTRQIPPPVSAYPRIADRTLVSWERLNFPRIPNTGVPGVPTRAFRLDYGPDFSSAGTVAHEPPELGSPYPIFVPNVDRDGNEIAGIKMPEIAVPLATYTGWALMHPDVGPSNVLAQGAGSFSPFPRTKSERLSTHDPRRSVVERYGSRANYRRLVAKAARELANNRYLLKADIPAIVDQAASRWDFIAAEPSARASEEHNY